MVAEISYIEVQIKKYELNFCFKLLKTLIQCCNVLTNHAIILSHDGACIVLSHSCFHMIPFSH